MTFLDKLYILQSVLRANYFGLRRPISCHFAVTNRCVWQCRYCGFKNMHKQECTTQQALDIVSGLADTGCKRLHLTGGEPALRQDLGAIVTLAKKRGMLVTIATTGWHCEKNWDNLRDIDIFFLSFDGPREIHDAQRGNGSYEAVTTAMDFLARQKKPFWLTTVLTACNIPHIDFILDTARDRNSQANFHLLYYTATSEYLDGSFHLHQPDADMAANTQIYQDAIAYLLKRKKGDMRRVIGSSATYLEALAQWGDLSEVYRKRPSPKYRCFAGKLYCYIDANGDLYPCGDVMGRVQPVSALEHGFGTAFRTLPPLPCESCIVACFNELNLMFSLNPENILNWLGRV